jgi:hypothetical protein
METKTSSGNLQNSVGSIVSIPFKLIYSSRKFGKFYGLDSNKCNWSEVLHLERPSKDLITFNTLRFTHLILISSGIQISWDEISIYFTDSAVCECKDLKISWSYGKLCSFFISCRILASYFSSSVFLNRYSWGIYEGLIY